MNNDSQAQTTEKDMMTASEVASAVVVVVSGFQFCKYLFSIKAISIIQDAALLPQDTMIIEKMAFFVALISCVTSLTVTACYNYEKVKSFTLRLNSFLHSDGKIVRLALVVITVVPLCAMILVNSAYGFLLALFMLTVFFIASGKLNRLAMFCVGYLALSFLMAALLIFHI